ncbi:histidine kinase [Paraflavitalea sp. CAU 1676]|uniref:sensor histidine kinase n=1 Tax=Paraflavitalea sp. CAU 1676 TaxID=3032598 RepID=UPI0023DADD1C|nr:histidine kinase [Paraflavitalea sp. CAU 1676]MDF2188856.1 histidine kinase [Paraflavitalea sp. CAU 1676]
MKKIILLIVLFCSWLMTPAQVGFKFSASDSGEPAWDNYSTTYLGDGSDSVPVIISALPNYGISRHTGNTPFDVSFSDYRFRSQLTTSGQQLYTYDSGDVYFLAPGIFSNNAALYEFRVVENGTKVIKPWGEVTTFVEANFQLNFFRAKFGVLGGFSTQFGNYLSVELRRKGAAAPFITSVVRWVAARPLLSGVYTVNQYTAMMLSHSSDNPMGESLLSTLMGPSEGEKLDTAARTPNQWIVPPNESGLIFQLRAMVYKKNVFEYRLLRNGRTVINWTGNKAPNSYIWIEHPEPGDQVLEVRYKRLPDLVLAFPFRVQAAWYQTWWFKAIGALLLLAFMGFIVLGFTLRRQRRRTLAEQEKKERAEQGLKSVYAQLNPHFTFNALSSIQGLINNNDIKGANQYLADFGSLVRQSLADSERPLIPLQRELQTIDTYLRLEKLRFNFEYAIHWDPDFPLANVDVPSLLLQPLVENAVKHGISNLGDKGKVRIDVLSQGRDLTIRITDNGAGFDAQQPVNGFGLKLTRDRIRLFNEMAGSEQIVLSINGVAQPGSTVTILFKNWLA